jgi:hypothetical protein
MGSNWAHDEVKRTSANDGDAWPVGCHHEFLLLVLDVVQPLQQLESAVQSLAIRLQYGTVDLGNRQLPPLRYFENEKKMKKEINQKKKGGKLHCGVAGCGQSKPSIVPSPAQAFNKPQLHVAMTSTASFGERSNVHIDPTWTSPRLEQCSCA